MRKLQTAVFTVAVLFTTGAVLAQNDSPGGAPKEPGAGQGERGGPRGGGRGGFGFGGRGGMGGVMSLLRIEEVRSELKVTEDQNAKIRTAGEEVLTSIAPPDVDREALRDGTDEEQAAARAKLREYAVKVEKEMRGKLTGILDDAQMKRLQGLWIQRAGALAALNNEQVAADIKLTDDQKSKLKTQLDEQPRFRFGGRRGGEGGTPPAGGGEGAGNPFERMQAARKEADDKALAVLTDEQKAQLDVLKGAKFDFPPPQIGGGFGGGRGGEGGGGGRRGRNAE